MTGLGQSVATAPGSYCPLHGWQYPCPMCSTLPQPAPQVQWQNPYELTLQRIAMALERIAAALEKES